MKLETAARVRSEYRPTKSADRGQISRKRVT